MENFNRTYGGAFHQSEASSIYSNDSTQVAAPVSKKDSVESFSSRSMSSSKPSYMNAAVPRKPAPISPVPGTNGHAKAADSVTTTQSSDTIPPQATHQIPKGLLLLVVAAAPPPATTAFVKRLLRKHPFSSIAILGSKNYETALKQLKMDIYAVIGRMSMELGVQMHMMSSFEQDQMRGVVAQVVGSGRIQSVLCCPANENADGDVLALPGAQIESSWKRSFGFIHAVGSSSFPLLQSLDHEGPRNSAFLLTQTNDARPLSLINKAACDTLLDQLATTYRPKGIAVGYAEEILPPELEPPSPGGVRLSAQAGPIDTEPYEYSAPESPTKLWNIWALQDELGAVD